MYINIYIYIYVYYPTLSEGMTASLMSPKPLLMRGHDSKPHVPQAPPYARA